MLCNAVGVEGCQLPLKKHYEGVSILLALQGSFVRVKFPGKKHYEGVRFNVISVTRG